MDHPHPSPHTRLDQHLATLSIHLCHTQELIALAYQLSCELHPQADAKAILSTSGRLATLMHVAAQQLASAQSEASALSQAVKPPPPKPPALSRRDH
jgi:hypothetical protein